jgi:uncharacterized damage-inducible protein DinB
MNAVAKYRFLFAYHWHVCDRLVALAGNLSDADYREGAGYGNGSGSIHDLLFHVLRVDNAWRRGFETRRQNEPLDAADFPDLPALSAGFAREREAWAAMLDTFDDALLDSSIDMVSLKGDPYTFTGWKLLEHVILHGMQHHAETAALLTRKGQSPGNLDILLFTDPKP